MPLTQLIIHIANIRKALTGCFESHLVALYVSFGRFNKVDVMNCVRHAVMAKDETDEEEAAHFHAFQWQ